ncbi:hypothetical protein [Aquimarina agarilytica]|uniref:hypothetical protein n=1 Tax=Aquimarina agarilytica TaxID=1087449 RepID=UPI0004923EFD|nr:hypothetical protein [Aquimarina agarilytica]
MNSSNSSLTKCIIWFYDGNIRTFYSFDKSHAKAKPNKALGIRRLTKMINQTFKGKYETAIIYGNLGNGVEIAKYKHGVRVL